MKTCLFILGLMCSLASAEEDSLNTCFQYYPLQVGDYWEYWRWTMDESTLTYTRSAYSIEVVGDTVLNNGLDYMILRRTTIYPSPDSYELFQRLDSSSGCIFQCDYTTSSATFESKVDSLFAQVGDTIHSAWGGSPRMVCDSIVSDTILGFPTQVRHVSDIEPYSGWTRSFAKGIGFAWEQSAYDFGEDSTRLVYARINGIEHGKRIDAISQRPFSRPNQYSLSQNFPNPFNPTTTIAYQLPTSIHVTLRVYDILGRNEQTLVDGRQSAGSHFVTFNAANLPSGVYLYRLEAGTYHDTKKFLLLK